MNYIGIDFGTTNSIAGILGENGKPIFAPLEGDETLMPSAIFVQIPKNEILNASTYRSTQQFIEEQVEQLTSHTFFSLLENKNSKKYFGKEALNEYNQNPLSGYLLRSVKSFLAVDISPLYQDLFSRTISLILGDIKSKSEYFFKKSFDGVLLGRPVNYMGAKVSNKNEQALGIMRNAAKLAGFSDVRFVVEPMAASLGTKEIFQSNSPSLIIDIGGGTTDVVLVQSNQNDKERISVLDEKGERVGGNDFDEYIAISRFGIHIGLNGILKDGAALPNKYVLDCLSTRDINKQRSFRESGNEIHSLILKARNRIQIERLYQAYQMQLQHYLISIAERFKLEISASEQYNFKFGKFTNSFSVRASRDEIRADCIRQTDLILNIVNSVMKDNDLEDKFLRVFITGGMSRSPLITDEIIKRMPNNTKFNRISALFGVAGGIAALSTQLSLSEESYLDKFMFRGIPITR